MDPDPVQHSPQRGQQSFQNHQGSHVHPCAGPHPQQEPGQVPAAAHMGPPPPGITHLTMQAFKPSNCTLSHLTPLLVPPSLHPLLPLSIMVGAHTFVFFLW